MVFRILRLQLLLLCYVLFHVNAEEFPIRFSFHNEAAASSMKKLKLEQGTNIKTVVDRKSIIRTEPGKIASTSFLVWGHGFKVSCSAIAKEQGACLLLRIFYRDNGVWKHLRELSTNKELPQDRYYDAVFLQDHNELQNRNIRHKIEVLSSQSNVAISDILIEKWPPTVESKKFTLPDNVTINLPLIPQKMEEKAAEELKFYISKCVESFNMGEAGSVVFQVGETDFALENNIKSKQLAKDEYIIKTVDNNVIVIGGGHAGTLFGVYRFIEDFLGVRWWTPMSEFIPNRKPITLQEIDLRYKPMFDYRNIYWMRNFDYPQKESVAFFSRIRLSTPLPFGSPKTCHSFCRYLPVEKNINTHPEYFSLANEKRTGGQKNGQVCLTNTDVRELFLKKLKGYIVKDEERAERLGLPPPYIYDISQNDNNFFCKCENCREIQRREGSLSGPLISFINYIADGIKEFRPNIYIQTFAYMHTEKPPKFIKPSENVIIMLTNISHNLAVAPDKNQIFLDNLEKWSRITSRIHIWDYSTTYGDASIPTPTEFRYYKTFEAYNKYNVKGIFWEHEFQAKGDMYELKLFLERKYLENPRYDFDALVNDFMSKYYGKAGKHLIKYRQALHAAAVRNNLVMLWNSMSSSYIDLETALECWKHCNQALASVSDDKIKLNRVRKAVIGFHKVFYSVSCLIIWSNGGEAADSKRIFRSIFNRPEKNILIWRKK